MGQRWRTHLSNLARWLLTRPKGRLSGGCVPCFNPSPSPLAALPLAPICTRVYFYSIENHPEVNQADVFDTRMHPRWMKMVLLHTFILLPHAEMTNFSKIVFGGLPWIFWDKGIGKTRHNCSFTTPMASFGHDLCRTKTRHMATLTRSNIPFFLRRQAQVCEDWVGAEWDELRRERLLKERFMWWALKHWSDGALMKAMDRNKRG